MAVERETRGKVRGFIQAASWHNLRQLMLVRNIAIVGQAFTLVVVHGYLAIPLPIAVLAAVTGFLVLFNLATFWRLRQPWPVTDPELFGQILVDICAMTVLFYFSGGTNNPFVGLFLVPVTIAAASLRWAHTLPVVLLTLACYSLLVFFHVPLPSSLDPYQHSQLMTLGMWVNYVVSAGLIAYFVVTIATLLREQSRTLAEAMRRNMSHEYLVRVGALAAGAAHEIRSPLSTMAVLVKELLQQHDDRRKLMENLRIMSDQIEACRRTLKDLVTSRQGGMVDGPSEPVDKFLSGLVDRWRVLRPGVKLACRWAGSQPPPKISTERSLSHALLNLLNNAADASPGSVELDCRWSAGALKILVQDRGPGIPSELGDMLGELSLTTKRDKGTGIGLLLAKIAIRRAGGTLMLSNRSGGGARAEVILPIPNPAAAGDSDREATRRALPSAQAAKPRRAVK